MARSPKSPKTPIAIKTFTHDADKRKNIPIAEFQSVAEKAQQRVRMRTSYAYY